MNSQGNGMSRVQKTNYSQREGTNWLLIGVGALLSTISIRLDSSGSSLSTQSGLRMLQNIKKDMQILSTQEIQQIAVVSVVDIF
ncbi:hypothetical protein K1719_010952 [Acacia pycnantha]|nr:hypothetical protein K1719_010952 [Acacia pycnantha]